MACRRVPAWRLVVVKVVVEVVVVMFGRCARSPGGTAVLLTQERASSRGSATTRERATDGYRCVRNYETNEGR
jgi:hypothetical protein